MYYFEFLDLHIPLPDDNLSIVDHDNGCGLQRLNTHQVTAVKKSLRGRFTLIQGPPGTGKTITGVHIAYWFAAINRQNTPVDRTTQAEEIPDKAPPQVLYCGPSNKSVDVVAEYLMKIEGIKVLRVYGNAIEQEEFPIPNKIKPARPIASQEELRVPENLRRIALHLVIRDRETSPYAGELRRYERRFAAKKKKKKRVEETTVEEYLQLIKTAELWAIRSSSKGEYVQVVLCTCSTAGSKRMKDACNNVIQCIVDECGMCTEPETLIPIVSSKAQQVVLIGDHKQLQPIVLNYVARSLGLRTSMFERFSDYAFMLEEQYRMHPDICEFPSRHFYQGRLVTPESVINRDRGTRHRRKFIHFWPSHTDRDYVPLVFCNVVGEEEELVVTTEEGNQRSKSNVKEKDKVVEVVDKLVNTCGVRMDQIVVLSPYRAQCHIIREDLANRNLSNVPVISIVKSQGSECDFVIISLVRSLPNSQIDHEPDGGWLRQNLGFVTDEHQINVALTRAKRGLCIIGNKNLLEVCEMWSYLIQHYQNKSCFVESAGWPRI
ncbi:hypothetical protein ACROYT_G038197 [Oculina patagonica]